MPCCKISSKVQVLGVLLKDVAVLLETALNSVEY